MKLSEVIKDLQEALAEHGDIDVRLQCDHGQTLMAVTGSGLVYAACEEYYIESSYETPEECMDDQMGQPEYKFFELQAF